MWKKRKRLLLLCIGLGFVALNVVAFNHAWKFTHFAPADSIRTSDPEDLGMGEKLSTLFLGITNPKPSNTVFPDRDYETVWIPARESHKMEAWWIRDTSSRGIVILFHGYAGKKSSLLPEAEAFLQLGYDCLLVDMLGHGGSPGNTTSLGVYESEDVQAAVSWAREQNLGKELLIYAFSMGAVAALRAAADSLPVDALILGCPFGSMLAAAEKSV